MAHRTGSIRAIAQALDLSPSVVHRVLVRGEGSERIPRTTRERIEHAARAQGYHRIGVRPEVRNRVALVARTRFDTGVTVYLNLYTFLSGVLLDHGADLVLVPLVDGAHQWRRERRDRQFIGVILLDYLRDDLHALVPLLGAPAVLFNDLADLPVDQVAVDDGAGAAALAEHLLALGHRRFAWVVDQPQVQMPHRSLPLRLQAVRERVRAAGGSLVETDGGVGLGRALAGRDRPTAAIFYDITMVPPALPAIADHGLRIPRDLSLACAGHPALASWFQPSMTLAEVPVKDMAAAAVGLLMDRLMGRSPEASVVRILSGRLLPGGSTGPAP